MDPVISAWPAAERIFHADERWRGADNGYSIPLGGDRTLWLFADSFVAEPAGSRTQAREVWGNTIAVMTGLDPTAASMRYYWRDGPAAFFPPPASDGPDRLVMWPGHGIRLDAGLLLFFQVIRMRFAPDDEHAPGSFEFVGWAARLIPNPDDDPPQWSVVTLAAPQNPYGIVVGSAQVLMHDGHLYAYSSNPAEPINAYLVRWPRQRLEAADLADPEWWCGEGHGWLPQSGGEPVPVLRDAKTEFTVHPDRRNGGYVQVQGGDYFSARMLWRRAPALVGPWSDPRPVYDPPERGLEGVALYAFKVHPQLRGADLVATYVTLPSDRDLLLRDERLYRPRIVRVDWR